MIRRNFSKQVKLYDITASDNLRPAMQCVCFKDGYAYAGGADQEDQIAENIFDWWISGKSYEKWYADKFLQQKLF